MPKQYGFTWGNTFLGLTAQKSILPPFESALEEGKSQVITGKSFEDILSALTGNYSDKNLIELFNTTPEVFAPIDAWASRVAMGKFFFRRKSTGELIENNSYLNKILSQPNPLQTFSELVYEYVCYNKLTGKNFLYSPTPETMPRVDYKNIINSYNLPSDQTEPRVPTRIKLFTSTKKEELILGYDVMKGTENEFFAKTANVMYSTALNMKFNGRKLTGYPPLLSAKKALMNLIAVYEARHVIYIKRGALGAIISKRTDAGGTVALKPKEKQKILEDIDSLQGVTKGKYPYAVVNTPIDFVRFSMSIQELMPFEETLADTAAIYATLGVPRELMPKNTDSTYANQKESEKGFVQNRIIPYGNKICELLTSFWNLHEADIEMAVDYSNLPSLQENKKEAAEVDSMKTKTLREKFLNGICTLNQWRIEDGKEKVSNVLYEKLIYDMSDAELKVVTNIINLQKMNPNLYDLLNNNTGAKE